MVNVFDVIREQDSAKQQPQKIATPQPAPVLEQATKPAEQKVGEETGPELVKRNALQYLSRFGESLLGLPANTKKNIQDALFGLYENVIPKTPLPSEKQIPGQPTQFEETPQWVKGAIYGHPEEKTLGGITEGPTRENLREVSKEVSEGYLEPKYDIEKRIGGTIEDASDLLIGLRGFNSPLTALQSATVGNLGAEIAKNWGFGEKGQDRVKMGLMVVSTIGSNEGARSPDGRQRPQGFAQRLYNRKYTQADDAIRPGDMMDATGIASRMRALQRRVSQGSMAPSEQFVYDQAQHVLDAIEHGQLSPERATALIRSLNEHLPNFNAISVSPSGQRARELAPLINRALEDSLERYGRRNPTFLRNWRQAQEVYGAVAESNRISQWITRHGNWIKAGTIGHAIMQASITPGLATGILGGAAVAIPAIMTQQLVQRIWASPTLRNYYLKALTAASAQNANAFQKNLSKLDQEAMKDKEIRDFVEQIRTESQKTSQTQKESQ